MHRNSLIVTILAVTALGPGMHLTPRPAAAQVPDQFSNLQILPKDISKRELMGMMRGFAGALGVRCSHCHVGPDNLQGMDFATDELAAKQTARQMMRMLQVINEQHIAGLQTASDARVQVSCKTCHRAVKRPESIGSLIGAIVESEGHEAAVARYVELREQYYGRAAYDFGPQPINSLAERLFAGGRQDDAIALLQMNNELHPSYGWSRSLLARFHATRGETDLALAAFEEALALEPDNPWIKGQIESLKQVKEGGKSTE